MFDEVLLLASAVLLLDGVEFIQPNGDSCVEMNRLQNSIENVSFVYAVTVARRIHR